jgi:MFS family permease
MGGRARESCVGLNIRAGRERHGTNGNTLLTPRFVLVVASGLLYFLALSMLLPVLPRYVENELGGGSIAVGIASGSLFVGAILLRPYAGRIGDRTGRRRLIIGGAAIVAATTAMYGLVHSLVWLVAIRSLTGLGEAAFFVGAATMITDLSPPQRRGEAVSYWSVAVYGGLAFGPVIGELVMGDDRFMLTWAVAAALAAGAALIGVWTRDVPRHDAPRAGGHLLHRAAVAPGTVLALSLIGLAGFQAFVPLYADDLGAGPEGVFLCYGVLVLGVRIVGARLPDTLGPVRAGSFATAFGAAGLAVMASWKGMVGLYAGTVLFSAGMSMLYPSLLLLALQGVPDSERASVVGTFSSFFDLSQALGAFVCGAVVAAAGNRGAFATGAVLSVVALVLLRSGIDPRTRNLKPVDDAGVALADPGL